MSHWLGRVVDILGANTTNLRELAELAGGNPKTFYLGTCLDGVDLSGQDLRGMQFSDLSGAILNEKTILDEAQFAAFIRKCVDRSMSRIIASSRHEERISILLDEMLSRPSTAVPLLNRFGAGNTKLEQAVSEFLHNSLVGTQATDDSIKTAVYRTTEWTIKRALMQTKGALLFYLASYLAWDGPINGLVRRYLSRSSSIFVAPHKGAIYRLLGEK